MSAAHVDAYLEYLTSGRGLSPATAQAYAVDVVQFMDYLAEIWGEQRAADFTSVTYPIIRHYMARLYNSGYQRRSMSRKLSAIRSFFAYLVSRELVSHNPASLVRSPKRDTNLPEFLYDREVTLLLDEPDINTPLGARDRALLEFFYATGCRRAEVVALDLAQVNLEKRRARVIGKRDREREVYFGEPCRDALRHYLEGPRGLLLAKSRGNQGEQAVFLSRMGRRLTPRAVNLIVEKYMLRVGTGHRITPHKLRHTFATHMLDNGADLRTIQELLGHVNLASTEIYTHVSMAGIKREYQNAHPLAALGLPKGMEPDKEDE